MSYATDADLARDAKNKAQRILDGAQRQDRDLTIDEMENFNHLIADAESHNQKAECAARVNAFDVKLRTPVQPIERNNIDTALDRNRLGALLTNVFKFARGEEFDSKALTNSSGMSTSVGSDGGFMVSQELVTGLMQLVTQKSKLLPFVTQRPTRAGFGGIDIPAIAETSRADGSRFGGVTASWISEGGAGRLTKPKLRSISLKLSKLLAFCAVTEELSQDAVNLAAFISDLYSSEIAFKVDDAILSGDGLGKPLGIYNSPALIEVAKESGQAADTIVFENIVKMWSRISVRNMKNLVWFVNKECLPELMTMTSPGIAPRPVWIAPEGASAAPYGTIFGRPVLECESASKLGDVGDICLCDLSDYIWTDRNGIENDTSIHVYFLTDEQCFRFRYRCNGTPYTNAAVASKANASFTTSPYVALAAR